MIPEVFSLYLLAAVDGAFVGYRDAVGRAPLLEKTRRHLRAMGWGLLFGHAALLLIAGAAALAMTTSASPHLVEAELARVARGMLDVYGAYALVVAATFVLYALPSHDVRGFVTLALFGVLTLLRAPLILAGALWAAHDAAQPQTWLVALTVALSVASLQKLLHASGVNHFDWSFALEEE